MESTGKLKIRNWQKYQQYKDRCPPWIKLHREILQSEDWVMWNDSSRLLAVVCMLLASRTEDGSIPNNEEYIKRAGYLDSVKIQPLIDCSFLELEGGESRVYQTLATCTTEESREEESRERVEREISVFPEWWARYPKGRKIDRIKCERKFDRLSKTDRLAAAGDGYQRWLDHWATIDAQYVPNPSTWLNNRRWESDPPPKPGATPNPANNHATSNPVAPMPELQSLTPDAFDEMSARWDVISVEALASMNPEEYETWVEPLSFIGLDNHGVMVLGCTNEIVSAWVNDHIVDGLGDLSEVSGARLSFVAVHDKRLEEAV